MHALWSRIPDFIANNWQELAGFLTGAVCVWLLIKQNIWNWPVGIVNNIFYIAVAVYGWWNWLHGGRDRSELPVRHASKNAVLGFACIAAVTTAILYWILRHTPSIVPLADGLTSALFLTAQYVMSRRLVENWWFWIVGDALVIGLYIYKQLYLTSLLYLVFLAMSIAALMEWRRAVRQVE